VSSLSDMNVDFFFNPFKFCGLNQCILFQNFIQTLLLESKVWTLLFSFTKYSVFKFLIFQHLFLAYFSTQTKGVNYAKFIDQNPINYYGINVSFEN